MRKLLGIFITLLLLNNIYPQNIEIHLFKNAFLEKTFSSITDNINKSKTILVYDNFSSHGSRDEYEKFFDSFEQYLNNLLIIPGYNEIYKAQSGLAIFKDYWNSYDMFKILNDSTFIFAFSSYPLIEGQIPFVREETVKNLKSKLSEIKKNSSFFIITNNDFSMIENINVLFNTLSNHKIYFISPGNKNYKIKNNTFSIPIDAKRNHNVLILKRDSLVINNKLITLKEIKEQFHLKKLKFDSKVTLDTIFSANATITTKPVVDDSLIYFTTFDGTVNCVNSNGELIWNYPTNSFISSNIAISGNIILVGTNNGDLFSLNKYNGELIQSIGFDDAITTNLLVKEYNGRKELISEKRSNSKASVILGLANGNFYCYDIETLEEYWKNSKLKDKLLGNFFNINERIYFSSENSFFCADSRNGLLIWKWKPSKKYNGKIKTQFISTDGKRIFVNDNKGFIYAIDVRLGKTLWETDKYKSISFSLSSDKNTLHIKSFKDKFYIIKSKNGRLVKRVNINFGNDFLPSIISNKSCTIYFGNNHGTLYRINNKYFYRTLLKNFSGFYYLTIFNDKNLLITNNGTFIHFEEGN